MTYGSGGWPFTLVLLAFFVPSVALSRVGRARKKQLTDIGKGGARDAWQVLANGGVATLCAVRASTRITTPGLEGDAADGASLTEPWIAAFAGAYAAATADTWGTEIGTLVRGRPHSILTLKPIATGLSGGVTLAGSAAEAAGALWIALSSLAALRAIDPPPELATERSPLCDDDPTRGAGARSNVSRKRTAVAIFFGGVFGALIDSVLGATFQELRRCPSCERTCETNPHRCGTPTILVRGIPGVSNDFVNAAATLTGGAVAFAVRSLQTEDQPRASPPILDTASSMSSSQTS